METITFKRDVSVVERMVDLVTNSEASGGSTMVCNNPGNNGGSWTPHNGYTGDCVAVAGTIDWSDLDSNSGAGGVGGHSGGGGGGGSGGAGGGGTSDDGPKGNKKD